jgi:hypothetical protein
MGGAGEPYRVVCDVLGRPLVVFLVLWVLLRSLADGVLVIVLICGQTLAGG